MEFNQNISLDAVSDNIKEFLLDCITTNEELSTKLKEAEEEIVYYKNKCADMDSQIHSDSSTSSKPPSHDWSSATSVGSLKDIMKREYYSEDNSEPKRKPGKQENSKGSGRKEPKNAKKIIREYKPVPCLNCIHCNTCTAESKCTSTRKVIDIEFNVTVTEHKEYTRKCELRDGEKISGKMPEGINSTLQFGIIIQSLCILLYIMGLSYAKINSFFSSIIDDAAPSVGTIANIIKRFGTSQTLNTMVRKIYEMLQNLHGPLNCDETGIRGKSEKIWLHTVCTPVFTYLFASLSRGYKAMIEGGTAFLAGNILIHDCWKSYFKIEGVLHGLCNAHIIRELAGVVIFYKQEWAKKMLKCLLDMYHAKKEALLEGKDQLADDLIQKFKDNMRMFANEGIAANPLPPNQEGKKRPKRPKPLALATRILEHLDEIVAFIVDFKIPFTNNVAERAVRSAKIKLKNAMYLTLDGAVIFAKIQSVLDTAKKQHISEFEAIKELLSGNELDFRYNV